MSARDASAPSPPRDDASAPPPRDDGASDDASAPSDDDALEARLLAYVDAHRELSVAEVLRAFRVRSYLWPALSEAERRAGAVAPDARVAARGADEVAKCLARWIRLREREDAFRAAVAAAARIVVVHGPLDAGAARALATLDAAAADADAAPDNADAAAAASDGASADGSRKRRRADGGPAATVASVAPRDAQRSSLSQKGYCVFPKLVRGDLDAWIRERIAPKELSFYPGWRASDFFHSAPSEPGVPISAALQPLRALLPGIEAAASAVAGEALVVLQANATLYCDATNKNLGDHRDGSPFSVIVHVSATRPETSGLEVEGERVVFNEPGSAVLLRGDEKLHRSVPVRPGEDRLVLVMFLDRADARPAAYATAASACPVSFLPVDGAAPLARLTPAAPRDVAAADLVLVVDCAAPLEVWEAKRVAAFDARGLARAPDFEFGDGPLARVLGFALGAY